MSDTGKAALHLLQDPEFKDLAARKDRISLLLTVATLVLYYGFILLVAFKPSLFGEWVGGLPLGIPIGVGVIVGCCVLTGIYVRWANSKYDAMVDRVREKAGDGA